MPRSGAICGLSLRLRRSTMVHCLPLIQKKNLSICHIKTRLSQSSTLLRMNPSTTEREATNDGTYPTRHALRGIRY